MSELWRPIEGWPYEVSDAGRVRRSIRYLNSTPDGVLKLQIQPQNGYAYVCLYRGGIEMKRRRVHILVAEAFLGPKPSSSHVVAHRDGCRTHNRPTNLRWSTYQENEDDKVTHGTRLRGERVHGAKCTPEIVRLIRASSDSIYRLAEQFGICASAIARVRNRTTWKHIP